MLRGMALTAQPAGTGVRGFCRGFRLAIGFRTETIHAAVINDGLGGLYTRGYA